MKYAIYDKAADAYLTKMIFDVGYSDNTQFNCEITEYITNARLLSTKEAADNVVADTESFKFMENGRFVVHSFDDALNDQYIISEAGNPTKVVDNITVDLSGAINVRYGTMMSHWSTMLLENAVNRMFVLQNAASDIYTSWNNTFDIYKVITIMDEKEHTHYQFINVTAEGLEKYSKNEEEKLLVVGKEITDITDPLHKRIEELEKDNSVLTDSTNYHNECRIVLANMIRAIKYAIYYIKDSDKRDNYISYMTDKIKNDETFNRPELKTAKNDIPKICKHLTILATNTISKRIEELEKANYELGEQVAERGAVANRLLDENNSLKAKVEAIKKEARDWKELYKNADADREELKNAIDVIYSDLKLAPAYCDKSYRLKAALQAFKRGDVLSRISMPTEVYYIHNNGTYLTAKDEICAIIDQILTIIESHERNKKTVRADEEIPKAIANDIIFICEADDKFEVTLKKFSELYETIWIPGTSDDVITHAFKSILFIFATVDRKLTEYFDEIASWKNKAQKAEKALEDQKKLNDANKATIAYLSVNKITKDKELSDWKRRVEEAIRDYTKCNEALGEWKRKYRTMREERDKALERAEFYKRQANSIYGMTVPGRCCGKQMFCDIATGKKILIDKKKYDDLVEYVANINLTYDTVFCMMDKPVYLSTITESLNDLTK